MKRLLSTLAAALVATMTAAPVMAQTTVMSSGREGPTTCLSMQENNAANMPITALSASSVTFTFPQVTWSNYVSRFGDGGRPTGTANVEAQAYNAKTNTAVGGRQAFAFLSSGSPTYAGESRAMSSLSQKTLYYVEYSVTKSGFRDQVMARRCFMTGGSYTMTTNPASGQTSGCFAISPRTREDVRNCLCGRGNNSPRVLGLFTDETENQALRDSLGCR